MKKNTMIVHIGDPFPEYTMQCFMSSLERPYSPKCSLQNLQHQSIKHEVKHT